MRKENKLLLQMSLFFLFVFVCLGLIVLDELGNPIISNNISQKINDYIDSNYQENLEDFEIKKLNYNKKLKRYEKKIVCKTNNNLYFIVYYKNKKINDTYKKDYLEGNSLFSYYEKLLTQLLDNKNSNYSELEVKIQNTLDSYNSILQKKIIESKEINDIIDLPIYEIIGTIEVEDFNLKNIINSLRLLDNYIKENNFSYRSYDLVLVNNKNLTECININISSEDLENPNINYIIDGILQKDMNLIQEYNVTFECRIN